METRQTHPVALFALGAFFLGSLLIAIGTYAAISQAANGNTVQHKVFLFDVVVEIVLAPFAYMWFFAVQQPLAAGAACVSAVATLYARYLVRTKTPAAGA